MRFGRLAITTCGMDKMMLDKIIEKYQAQPVGDGYIDIIISRNKYKEFASELLSSGFIIRCISWWEWCSRNKESQYGMGGPKSIFYDGRFSEIPVDVDNIDYTNIRETNELLNKIVDIIETKTIAVSNETVTFKDSEWLTPAFWLVVPDEWNNKHSF